MDVRRLTAPIYRANVDGNERKHKPRRPYLDQIGDVLKNVMLNVSRFKEHI